MYNLAKGTPAFWVSIWKQLRKGAAEDGGWGVWTRLSRSWLWGPREGRSAGTLRGWAGHVQGTVQLQQSVTSPRVGREALGCTRQVPSTTLNEDFPLKAFGIHFAEAGLSSGWGAGRRPCRGRAGASPLESSPRGPSPRVQPVLGSSAVWAEHLLCLNQ